MLPAPAVSQIPSVENISYTEAASLGAAYPEMGFKPCLGKTMSSRLPWTIEFFKRRLSQQCLNH